MSALRAQVQALADEVGGMDADEALDPTWVFERLTSLLAGEQVAA